MPSGDALVVTMDAQGYRGAAAMTRDEALELPSFVYRKAEQKHDLARRDGDEAVACQSKPGVIVDEEVAYADGHQGATLHRQTRRWPLSSPITEMSQAPSLEMSSTCDDLEPSLTASLRLRAESCQSSFQLKPQGPSTNLPCQSSSPITSPWQQHGIQEQPGLVVEETPVSHEEEPAEPVTFATATDAHETAEIAEMRAATGIDSPKAYFASLPEYEQTWIEGEMRKRMAQRDGNFVTDMAFSAMIMAELWVWMREKGLTTASSRAVSSAGLD